MFVIVKNFKYITGHTDTDNVHLAWQFNNKETARSVQKFLGIKNNSKVVKINKAFLAMCKKGKVSKKLLKK